MNFKFCIKTLHLSSIPSFLLLLVWRCKQFEFSSDLAREFPRKEEVIMSKCWRILKYIGTPCPAPPPGLANIKITRETRDPESRVSCRNNWNRVELKIHTGKTNKFNMNFTFHFSDLCHLQNVASRHLCLSHGLWMCFVKFVYFLSKALGHIVIIIPKIGNIVSFRIKIMFSLKKNLAFCSFLALLS